MPSNEGQIDRVFKVIEANDKPRVGLLGLAFKPGTDDLRESPLVAVEIMGVSFHRLTNLEARGLVMRRIAARSGGWIATLNVDILRLAAADADFRRVVDDADLVLVDGMPIVWASRLLGDPLPERVPGSQLLWDLCADCAEQGASVFFLGGGDQAIGEAAAQRLQAASPRLRFAGVYAPPIGFENAPEEMARLREALRSAAPDLVFCALGAPKQERLMVSLRSEFPSTWFVAAGGAITMASGEIRRAPVLLQRVGFEWMYRLMREPRRLFRRYVLHDIPFALRMFASTGWRRFGC